MTSLLVQPYHPRKDAIKIIGIGLNDVALQVSSIILQKKNHLPVALVLQLQSCSSVGQSFCGKRKRHIFSASRGFAGAAAACWLCAHLPADISSRNAARWSFIAKEGPLFPVLFRWLLRVSAEFCIYVSSHHHSVVQREQQQWFACIPCLFFPPRMLKGSRCCV